MSPIDESVAAALALVALDDCGGDAAAAVRELSDTAGLDPEEKALAERAAQILRERTER